MVQPNYSDVCCAANFYVAAKFILYIFSGNHCRCLVNVWCMNENEKAAKEYNLAILPVLNHQHLAKNNNSYSFVQRNRNRECEKHTWIQSSALYNTAVYVRNICELLYEMTHGGRWNFQTNWMNDLIITVITFYAIKHSQCN